jgi:hypothetical protein
MENWNPEDYQGKRKDQVDFSAKVLFYCIIAMFTTLVIGLIIR